MLPYAECAMLNMQYVTMLNIYELYSKAGCRIMKNKFLAIFKVEKTYIIEWQFSLWESFLYLCQWKGFRSWWVTTPPTDHKHLTEREREREPWSWLVWIHVRSAVLWNSWWNSMSIRSVCQAFFTRSSPPSYPGICFELLRNPTSIHQHRNVYNAQPYLDTSLHKAISMGEHLFKNTE